MSAHKLRGLVQKQGITSLFHFSPFPNLESILLNGLLSRKILDDHEVQYLVTDSWRKDGAVCLSIHDINRSMFRQKKKDMPCDWVIIAVDARVLWTHRCEFAWVNAASKETVDHRGYRGGPWAFNMMFKDADISRLDKRSSRETYKIPKNEPTRNDAEVQVLDPITPDLIQCVLVERERHVAPAQAAMKRASRTFPVLVQPEAFQCAS